MGNDLTVIIPAFNEEQGIRRTILELLPFTAKNNWQVIIIDDGSSDNTSGEISDIDGITVVSHPYNKGYGAALKTGIRKVKTPLIALYDADGQHRPEDLENLYNNFSNYDMLVGERGKDSHSEWVRKPGKWVLSKTANFLSGRKIPDLNSGLRVIRKDIIIKMLHLFPDGFSFSTTSTIALINMGYNVDYFPIKTNKRSGRSTVNQIKHGSNTLLLILRLIVLFSPLKVFLPASIILGIFGIIYEIIFGWILLPVGIKLIPTAFFILLTSLLIFFFGLVVDQVSEMRKHQFDYLNEK
jgi:glycosyltransferase involved in cell wall biosynthesis